ncbi:hypothetical protein QAD02_024261 [Eretmocerus hayati]|uniref:Uncharacterized protein n=1 Tax=Eretmocerus hayati TaxID=131215 RepID=A0ACC2Q0E1_9HYME|nr:hypothetical protein QAD02_024261 [Eretmocerus hayati]
MCILEKRLGKKLLRGVGSYIIHVVVIVGVEVGTFYDFSRGDTGASLHIFCEIFSHFGGPGTSLKDLANTIENRLRLVCGVTFRNESRLETWMGVVENRMAKNNPKAAWDIRAFQMVEVVSDTTSLKTRSLYQFLLHTLLANRRWPQGDIHGGFPHRGATTKMETQKISRSDNWEKRLRLIDLIAVLLFLMTNGIIAEADEYQEATFSPTEEIEVISEFKFNIDSIVDYNIGNIRNHLKSVDPTELPNIERRLTSNTYLHLYEGVLGNLARMERTGRCVLSLSKKIFTLDGIFGWDSLEFQYQYLLKVLLFSKTGSITGRLDQLQINLVVDIDEEAHEIVLRQLDFINAGEVTIRLNGHVTDFIYNLMLKAGTWVVKGFLLKNIEEEMAHHIQLYMPMINKILAEFDLGPFTFVNNAARNRRSTDSLYDFDDSTIEDTDMVQNDDINHEESYEQEPGLEFL